MADQGLLDTSAVIDLAGIPAERLPAALAISAVTLAELSAGVLVAHEVGEQSLRQSRLQWVESVFEPLPVDAAVARAYGRVYAAVVASGRHPRTRVADLLIAATAVAHGLRLVTRNPADLVGLEDLLEVLAV